MNRESAAYMFEDMVFNQSAMPSEADVNAVKLAARSIAADLDPDGVRAFIIRLHACMYYMLMHAYTPVIAAVALGWPLLAVARLMPAGLGTGC